MKAEQADAGLSVPVGNKPTVQGSWADTKIKLLMESFQRCTCPSATHNEQTAYQSACKAETALLGSKVPNSSVNVVELAQSICDPKNTEELRVIEGINQLAQLSPCTKDAYAVFAWIAANPVSENALLASLHALATRATNNQRDLLTYNSDKGCRIAWKLALYSTLNKDPAIREAAFKYLGLMYPKAAYIRSYAFSEKIGTQFKISNPSEVEQKIRSMTGSFFASANCDNSIFQDHIKFIEDQIKLKMIIDLINPEEGVRVISRKSDIFTALKDEKHIEWAAPLLRGIGMSATLANTSPKLISLVILSELENRHATKNDPFTTPVKAIRLLVLDAIKKLQNLPKELPLNIKSFYEISLLRFQILQSQLGDDPDGLKPLKPGSKDNNNREMAEDGEEEKVMKAAN